jgi:hypothetical protein
MKTKRFIFLLLAVLTLSLGSFTTLALLPPATVSAAGEVYYWGDSFTGPNGHKPRIIGEGGSYPGPVTFTFQGQRDRGNYFWTGHQPCSSNPVGSPLEIEVAKGSYELLTTPTGAEVRQKNDGIGSPCELNLTNPIQIAESKNAAGPPGPSNDSGSGAAEPTCEKNGGDMSWLLCPILRQLDNVVGYLDEQINYLLTVPSSYYEQPRLKETWGSLRNLALLILLPIMLVMVISTALGFDFVSAYTVKKAMPRFLAAVLFISLSWPITVFIVQLINVFGQGIGGLMAASFGGMDSLTLASLFNSNAGADAGAGILLGIIGVGAISVVSIGVILSFLGMAAIGLFVGYVLLVMRQFLVVALMLLAPLAILSWIFPGNDKLWKSWWGTFSKLLLLYPLVIIVIAAGRIFAKIVQETPGDVAGPDGFAATLIKLIAYVGPYFFIPALFKFAGGVFATVAGIANDKERGLFDRQKKYRQGKMGQNWQKARVGDRFQRNNIAARAINRAGAGVGAGWKGRYGFGQKGRDARFLQSAAGAARNAKENELLQQLALGNDDGSAVMMLSGGTATGGRQAANDLRNSWYQQYLNENMQSGMSQEDAERDALARSGERSERAFDAAAATGFSRQNAQAMFTLNPQNKSRAIGGGEYGLVQEGINRLAGNNTELANGLGQTFQYYAYNSGRADLGRPTVAGGIGRSSPSQVVQGYTEGTRAVAQHLTNRFNGAVASGNTAEAVEAAAEIAALRNVMGSATPDNRAVLTDMFRNVNLDLGSNQSVDEQLGAIIQTRVPGTPAAGQLTNQIRQRAGLYDSGSRGLDPLRVADPTQRDTPPEPPQP